MVLTRQLGNPYKSQRQESEQYDPSVVLPFKRIRGDSTMAQLDKLV
jgi:hypothetical protein